MHSVVHQQVFVEHYQVPDTGLGTKDTMVNETNMVFVLMEFTVQLGINHYVTQELL